MTVNQWEDYIFVIGFPLMCVFLFMVVIGVYLFARKNRKIMNEQLHVLRLIYAQLHRTRGHVERMSDNK